jgi:L-malate glycosyltransferase
VFPIAIDTRRITEAPPHPALERVLRDEFTNFLFVGRIVPNKKIEDIILLAEQFKRYVDAHYRFIFVGRTDGVPRYYAASGRSSSASGCCPSASSSRAR